MDKDKTIQICEPSYGCYDIVFDNLYNRFRIDIYKTTLEAFYHQNKRYVRRVYKNMGCSYPKSLKREILDYQRRGYRSITEFLDNNFMDKVFCDNPFLMLKLMVKAKNLKMLEKLYDIENNNIITYIVFINMNTGKIHIIKMNKMVDNEFNRDLILKTGYKDINISKLVKLDIHNKELVRVRKIANNDLDIY